RVSRAPAPRDRACDRAGTFRLVCERPRRPARRRQRRSGHHGAVDSDSRNGVPDVRGPERHRQRRHESEYGRLLPVPVEHARHQCAGWVGGEPGGSGRLVCVLDTGVDPQHIDLKGRVDLSKSKSFVASDTTIQDFNTHGTFVSSIITSNGRRLASVAPNATLCAIKVLGASGSGSFADVIAGILFAANENADVINMSLGAIVDNNQPGVPNLLRHMQKAIDYAHSRGVVVVAAAGNEALDLDAIPKNFSSVPAQLQNV